MRLDEPQRRERDATLCEAFRNGAKRSALCLAFNLSPAWVSRILKENGCGKRIMPREQRCERDAAIYQAFHSGMDTLALMKEFNLSRNRVREILKEHGWSKAATTEERNRVIREMHLFGLTAEDMAFELNLSRDTVCDSLRNMGLTPTLSWNKEQDSRDSRNERICEAFCNGSSRDDIMQQFQLSRRTVTRALESKGLTRPVNRLGQQQRRERDTVICEAFRNGKDSFALSQEFNISEHQIRDILKHNGSVKTTTTLQRREQHAAIYEAFRNGKDSFALSQEFNISKGTVWRILRQHRSKFADEVSDGTTCKSGEDVRFETR